MSHAELLDSIYGWQTGFYDLTRRYYLQGRELLLADIASLRGTCTVLEVGCGTGRNLIKLARKNPSLRLFGMDACGSMLEVATRAIPPYPQITVAQGYAEELRPDLMFGIQEPFDEIFFSFSLSMIPEWERALEAALAVLAPGGVLRVVDFWDQHTYPPLLRRLLTRWLKLFHVAYNPAHIEFFSRASREGRGSMTLRPVWGSYSYYLSFRKN